jgi:deazaflavin-dependent oxidoreductase (nitroreductase family)
MTFHRWLYKDGHPNWLAKALNRGWAVVHSTGIFPNYMVTLELAGRQSGKLISFPLAMLVMDNERYLVSMLGKDANWVRNLKAAGGKAVLRHGIREEVMLQEVAVDRRAAILKAYLQIAPGARPHIPVDKDAPVSEFAVIAANYPVFLVVTNSS